MTEILTAAQMRAIEQAAIESGRASGLELMERAGKGVVEAVFEAWPELAGRAGRAVVLCGPGNNGGDGFVVARLLTARGWQVELRLFGAPDRLPPDARRNFERWNGPVLALTSPPAPAPEADLLVDALFGTGLSRAIEDPVLKAWLGRISAATAAEGRLKTVAVDIASGLCADSGRILGAAAQVMLSVSFHRPKCGHFLGAGLGHSGRLVVADIGLEGQAPGPVARLLGPPDAGALGKRLEGHKYSHGHALILAGPAGRGGAARLAARGALRIGAGAVTLGVPPAALTENAAQVTAIMLAEIDEAGTLAELLRDARIKALCLGPGLGQARARALVPAALAAGRACVLDADALSGYMKNPSQLFENTYDNTILTPHAGEFARLFPDLAERLRAPAVRGPAFSRLEATRAAAARAGAVVVFKGPDTVIAAPDGRAMVHARPAPWLATAGSGDVLAGFIAGLLARGWGAMAAAGAGVWLHAECARRFGPGLIAEDLPEALPQVLRDLGV